MSASDLVNELIRLIPAVNGKKSKSKLRRTKRRLAKSLKKQIISLLELKSYNDIKSDLWKSMALKFKTSIIVEQAQLPEQLSRPKDTEWTEEENVDKVYRCLHPIEKRLINLVADSIIKELKEDRMRKLFSYRTVKLCSSALCNGLLGNINDNVASSDITIIDNSFINVVSTIKFNDEFVYKSANYQQRTVMTKQVNSSHKNTLLILGHELKMLRYLGSHENIIKPIGLTESIETISSIFEHVATIDLVEYARMHPTYLFDQVKWIIKNLTSALQFIHSKSIILNNLVEQSILMRPTHGYSVPVIIDFSCACHTVGVTCLTQYFQEKFSKTNHLPNEVLCGNRKPSFSSDIYSFGHLISTFASKMINRSGNSERCTVENIAFELLHSDHENFPDILYNLIS